MMLCKRVFSLVTLGAVIAALCRPCHGIAVTAAKISAQQETFDDIDDAIPLLQASAVKVTKSSAELRVSTTKATSGAVPAVPSSTWCSSAERNLLKRDEESADAFLSFATAPSQGQTSTTSIKDPEPMVVMASVSAPDERLATVLFRNVLRVLILLLFADGSWRLASKERRHGHAANTGANLAGLLRRSALAGDAERCKTLIHEGAAAEEEDVWGSTPLHAASAGGSITVLRMILARGVAIDPRDAIDETPLHLAARKGHVDSCELLLAYGAEIDALNSKGQTPLVVSATEAKHMGTCELLLGRGAGAGMLSDRDLPPALASLLAQEVLMGGSEGALLPGVGADQADWDYDEMNSRICLPCGGRFFSTNDECMACGEVTQRRQ